MYDNLTAVIVTRKWQLARGFHAVELQTKFRSRLPPFDDGAYVDLVPDRANYGAKSYALCSFSSRPDAYVLVVRQEGDGDADAASLDFALNHGKEVFVSTPRSDAVPVEDRARSILFATDVGVATIAGIAKRLAAAGQSFELHNFARSPERALYRDELDKLRGQGRVHHYFGQTTGQISQIVSHALSPTQANSQIYCSGPSPFVDLVHRQAREWVYSANVHDIVLGGGESLS